MSLLVQIVPRLKKRSASIKLPKELEQQISALAGRRGRAAFIREAVRQEIERRRLLVSAPTASARRNGRKKV